MPRPLYDALGRMVEQQSGSATTEILYSPAGKTALMNGQTLTKAFLPLPGGATAIYNSTGLAYYRHSDWIGSSRLTSSQARGLYSSSAYAPFGETYAVSGASDPSFTGQNSDAASTLYDFTFREHSPSQGRWISPDPAGVAAVDPTNPQTWNRYAYVGNNPVALIDPLGLDDCACDWWWDGGGDGGGGDGSGVGGYSGFWGGIGEGPNDPPLPLPCQEADFCMSVWVPADPASSGTGYASPGPDQSYNCGIFCLWQPNIGIPEQGSGGGGGGGAANNRTPSWFQRTLNYLKSHPITISVNEIFAGQITYQASTGTICGSVGAGASVPPTKAVTVGILNEGNMGNWQGAISGPSYSFGANLFVGYQGTFSSSGNVGGPTVSGIGLSGSYTIGGCTTVP